MTFEDLNLNQPLLDALSDLGFTQPTPIQHKVFSVIMSGRDVVGTAQTGTGKTFAYLLPILRQLRFSDQKEPCYGKVTTFSYRRTKKSDDACLSILVKKDFYGNTSEGADRPAY